MTSNSFCHVESNRVNCNLVGFTWGGFVVVEKSNIKLVWLVLTGFIHLLPIIVFEPNIHDDLCLPLFVCLPLLSSFFTLSLPPKGCAGCSVNLRDQETLRKSPRCQRLFAVPVSKDVFSWQNKYANQAGCNTFGVNPSNLTQRFKTRTLLLAACCLAWQENNKKKKEEDHDEHDLHSRWY